MHFHGTKNGRRLDRTKFRSQEGFLEELDTSDSNAIFVKTLSKLGIGQKKTKRKNTPNTISNAMPNPLYANMMAITSSQSEELDFVKKQTCWYVNNTNIYKNWSLEMHEKKNEIQN